MERQWVTYLHITYMTKTLIQNNTELSEVNIRNQVRQWAKGLRGGRGAVKLLRKYSTLVT